MDPKKHKYKENYTQTEPKLKKRILTTSKGKTSTLRERMIKDAINSWLLIRKKGSQETTTYSEREKPYPV